MTVQDLIEALKAFDPELSVVIPSRSNSDFCEVSEVFADVVSLSRHHDGLELCAYEDDGCRTVLRLGERADLEERDEWPKPLSN